MLPNFSPMSEPALPIRPDLSHLVTEDDEPVDNWFQERQQRLLSTSLYSSWARAGQSRQFLVAANVGLFFKISEPAVVPDVMVSLDVSVPEDWWEKHNRSYMIWEFGKPPELVVEIVSNRDGGEEQKLERYASLSVAYSVLYDPRQYLGKRPLRVFTHHAGRTLDVVDPSWLEPLGLGLMLWDGVFEGMSARWLRWCDRQGNVLLTGEERAVQEAERADQEAARADQEAERAAREAERAERLAAKLRELGLEPD